jgi:hypothetical protein
MATRKKATTDLRIEQGKRRDAYFERLKRTAQARTANGPARPSDAKQAAQ